MNEWKYEILHTKIYVSWLLHTVLAHQKLLIKNKRVFLWMKVSISRYFHEFKGLKTVCQSRSFEVFGCWFVEVRDRISTSSYQKVENIWKRDNIRALNPRPEKNLHIYKKLAKKGFQIQSLWINHFILNLITKISWLQDSFDDNEDLLCGKHYQEGKRPGDIKLSPDRRFLIPKENKRTWIY